MHSNSHFIEILNVNNNEVVTYSLILIKGIVNCDCNIDVESGKRQVTCSNNINNTSYNWPIISNHFRCLISLEVGLNSIEFSYLGIVKKISLEFQIRKSQLYVVPVYFTFEGHNGHFECITDDNSCQKACQKISFCAQLIQSLYAEKLYEHGLGRKTFQLEDISNTKFVCRVFKSRLVIDEVRKLSCDALWEILARELMNSDLGSVNYKYLGITSSTCSKDGGRIIVGDVALGCGGLALIGCLPLCTWPSSIEEVIPCFSDSSQLHLPLSNNVWYRGTRGGCCSASLGSLCHELGHTFDLGHPNTGIMSTDFHLLSTTFLPFKYIETSSPDPPVFELELIPNFTPVIRNDKTTSFKQCNSQNYLLNKSVCYDQSKFSKGCATILSCHKWFNDYCDTAHCIEFDSQRKILHSEAGLRVVQRRGDNGQVLKSWELNGEKTQHMVVPKCTSGEFIFAIDNLGNILNCPIP